MNNVFLRLASSRKAVSVLFVIGFSFGALYLGKAHFEQVADMVKWLLGTWLVAQGAEDAAKHLGASKLAPKGK